VNGKRKIPIDDFFVDYKKTSLLKNEIITSISIPLNKSAGRYGFFKVADQDEDISKVNLAYAVEPDSVKFACGGAAKIPTRLKNVELTWGKRLSIGEWTDALSLDIAPISDIRSTAEYRKSVLARLLSELSLSFQG
jgi:xanthine dehydrogenase small subunit